MPYQQQKSELISLQQSKILIRNMIRVSVSSICFYREIFPEYCFVKKPYGNNNIVQLEAAELGKDNNIVVKDQKAFLLTQWLERGVFKILDDGFLRSMTFAVYTQHPLTKEDLLLETYEFKFDYEDGKPVNINGVQIDSKDSVKNQASKFIRNLVIFAENLDELPTENWITIEVQYNDNVEDDYEPEYFKTVGHSSLNFSSCELMKVKLGQIHTPYLKTSARFAGLESLLAEDLRNIGITERNDDQQPNRRPQLLKANTDYYTDNFPKENTVHSIEPDDLNITDSQVNNLNYSEEDLELIENVRIWILENITGLNMGVNLGDCEIKFNIPRVVVKNIFLHLARQNVLLSTKNRFRVNPEYLKDHLSKSQAQAFESRRSNMHETVDDNNIFEINEITPKDDIKSFPDQPNEPSIKGRTKTYKKKSLNFKHKDKFDMNHSNKVELITQGVSAINTEQESTYVQNQIMSQDSNITITNKRLYGQIKEPIHIQRNWNKKSKVNEISNVSPSY